MKQKKRSLEGIEKTTGLMCLKLEPGRRLVRDVPSHVLRKETNL